MKTFHFKCEHTSDGYKLGRYGACCNECGAKMIYSTSHCVDCGVQYRMTPRQGNRVRCVDCATLRKIEYRKQANKAWHRKTRFRAAQLTHKVERYNIFFDAKKLFSALILNGATIMDDRV
ncbi:MAG: hypothetical protein GY841_12310 [FCB group bacterium]|nr:hypothetical protein [FCB group bacterium]